PGKEGADETGVVALAEADQRPAVAFQERVVLDQIDGVGTVADVDEHHALLPVARKLRKLREMAVHERAHLPEAERRAKDEAAQRGAQRQPAQRWRRGTFLERAGSEERQRSPGGMEIPEPPAVPLVESDEGVRGERQPCRRRQQPYARVRPQPPEAENGERQE